MKTAIPLLSLVVFGFALAAGCSGDPGDGEGTTAPPAPPGATDDGQLFPGADPNADATERCATSPAFASCYESCQAAHVGPANLFITFDRSLSMADDAKWENATAALKSFVADPGSEGLGVALRFFPEGACADPTCDVGACADPAVPFGVLDAASGDAHEAALLAAIDERKPESGTPMRPALEGALRWATDGVVADPSRRNVVVLVTDGAPFGCHSHPDDVNADVAHLAELARQAREAHGVPTYVVGLVGSWEWIVDAIAAGGGTGEAILVGNEATNAELFAALQAIKESEISCEIDLAQVEGLDPAKVNVTFTPGGASEAETLVQVAGAEACEDGGWYYDDPKAPTRVVLCPSTCARVQQSGGAKLDVVLGCTTEVPL